MDWIISLAHWFGSAVCHQLPEDSYYIGGVELPLCARCSGMYLGALFTLIFHAWHHPRAIALRRPWVLVALALFFLAWAGDGLNSFLSAVPVLPHLYPPQNILRLITGTLMGITLGSLIFVMSNSLIWRNTNPAPIIETPRELLALLGMGALVVIIVQSEWGFFLYPLTLASLIAVLVLNSALMSALAASLMANLAQTWREARRPLTVGTAIALVLLNTLALFRVILGIRLGNAI